MLTRNIILLALNVFGNKAQEETMLQNRLYFLDKLFANASGIDLNFQPQFIKRGKASYAAEVSSVNLSVEFKGFDFNIVRFTPNLTTNGAFQLMFNSS